MIKSELEVLSKLLDEVHLVAQGRQLCVLPITEHNIEFATRAVKFCADNNPRDSQPVENDYARIDEAKKRLADNKDDTFFVEYAYVWPYISHLVEEDRKRAKIRRNKKRETKNARSSESEE